MSMMTAAILAVAITTAIITTIETVVDAVRRAAAPDDPTSRAAPRRQARRPSGVSYPTGVIRPQYLPALAQSRLLRLRAAHLSTATRHRR